MSQGREFEAKFVEILEDFISRRDLEKKKLAEKVWPEQAKPDNKLQRILKGQNVTLSDAYDLAEAIGYDFPDFIEKVYKALKARRAPSQPGKGKHRPRFQVIQGGKSAASAKTPDTCVPS